MKWQDLLGIIGREPLFESTLLIAGQANPAEIRRQLSRWTKSGRLVKMRRGLYALSERYLLTRPHPFLLANRLKKASYVSLQSALGYYGLIPEYVPAVTSVTTVRPEILSNQYGTFIFKHIKKSLFFGYRQIELGDNQFAFIASPEKALVDLLYLTPGSDEPEYINELRLQNTNILDKEVLLELAARSRSQKLIRASRKLVAMLKRDGEK